MSNGTRPASRPARSTPARTPTRTGAVTVPVYQTSTYAQDAVGEHKGYEYARTGNPTRLALERYLASLEGGGPRAGVRLRVGGARRRAAPLGPGDHVLLADDAYGGTCRLFAKV